MVTALGLASGAMTTLSFLPQVVRAVRTGSTADLSWAWLVMFAVGIVGWVSYGLLISNVAVTVTNVVVMCLVGVLIVVKARQWLPRGLR